MPVVDEEVDTDAADSAKSSRVMGRPDVSHPVSLLFHNHSAKIHA